jgi:Helix-turn-helix domain
MGRRALIPLPGVGTLALEQETYCRALEEGAKFNHLPEPSADPNELFLDSKQLVDILQVPATWILQQAREGHIPSLPFGRRRRYRRSDVEAAISMRFGNPHMAAFPDAQRIIRKLIPQLRDLRRAHEAKATPAPAILSKRTLRALDRRCAVAVQMTNRDPLSLP